MSFFFRKSPTLLALVAMSGSITALSLSSRAAPSAPDFGSSGPAVCPQLCVPVGSNPCANPCAEKAKAEEVFRKTSEFVQPSRVDFPSRLAAGQTAAIQVRFETNSPCTQLNPHLSHALVDAAARQIRLRIAAGQKAEVCTDLFVERELHTQLAVKLQEAGVYEVISETDSASSMGSNQQVRGSIEVR